MLEQEVSEKLEKYYNDSGYFQYSQWIKDYADEIASNKEKMAEAIKMSASELNFEDQSEKFRTWADDFQNAGKEVEDATNGVINTLLQVPLSMEEYDSLNDATKSALTGWIKNSDIFKIDENTTEAEILKMRNQIKTMIRSLANDDYYTEIDGVKVTAQDILDRIVEIDPSKVNWQEYQSKMQELLDYLWEAIGAENNTLGYKDKQEMTVGFGFKFVYDDNQGTEKLKSDVMRILNLSAEDAQKWINSLPATTVQAMIQVDWSPYGKGDLTQDGMVNKAVPQAASVNSNTVKSYNALNTSTSNLNDVLSQSANIFQDNVKISDEMGEALKSLIGESEDWGKAVTESNGYVVKNASLLRKMIVQQKAAQKAMVRTSKAQAQLQYQKTIQQIRQAISAMQNEVKTHGLVSNATLKTIDVLRSQLTTLKETIQQYALLEVAMSDAANAYTEYENAKERDSRLSYDESFLEALKTIDDGILSGKVGTEEFEYAVKLIVPEDVYKAKQEISDIDGMVRAIHDYCDGNPLLANWFTVDEDSGDLSITTDNIRAFIDDALEAGALVGDASNFQIAEGVEGLEQFTAILNATADGAGVIS